MDDENLNGIKTPLDEKSLSKEVFDDEESAKIAEELQNLLPKWVTLEQVSDMIRDAGGNIVEIVDNFYEHETKFYEEVSVLIDTSPVSEIKVINLIPEENEGSSRLLQFHKLQGTGNSPKNNKSPAKRNKKAAISKPKKKAKAKLESTDSKQATITRFFDKVTSNVTKD